MNLLIVDDHATNLKLLRAQLEAEGHTVLEAADGVEALAVLESQPADAIISDILMPNLDGYGLCHAVRQHARFGALPFVFYTATYVSPSDRQLGLSVGVDGYLIKPAPVAIITQALHDALRRSSASVPVSAASDAVVFKLYNAALVSKLEEKNAELRTAFAALERAREDIAEQNRDLDRRVVERTAELSKANAELKGALAEVKELSGLLPICSDCKKIRDDKNYWQSVEGYLSSVTDAKFSHGYCPDCQEKRLAELRTLVAANRIASS